MPAFSFDRLSGGLNYRDAYTISGKSELVYWIMAANIKPFDNTGIAKCNGNTLIVDHGTKIITAGNYNLGNSEYIMFVDSAGSMFEYDTATSTKSSAILTGLNASARGAWAVFGQGIIYSNGVDEPTIILEIDQPA